MKILGIETSCDETAAAVVEDGSYILVNIVSSQMDIHARYGGIVPEVASRQHLLSILPVIQNAFNSSGVTWGDLAGVAVTNGPGLAGSLVVGINLAKTLAFARGLPLIGVNHLEGHIYANWIVENKLRAAPQPTFPLICLVVSGGHSEIVYMKGHGEYSLVGQTRDDAAGEAFDKAARILGLGYPGGPMIENKARMGNPAILHLPRPRLKGSHDFSFSGLKTALWRVSEMGGIAERSSPSRPSVADAAASFQEAVVDILVARTVEAAQKYNAKQILLAGGVAANGKLRQRMVSRSSVPVSFPCTELCTDNAAMIAACGYYRMCAGETSHWDIDAFPSLRMFST